MKCQRKDWTLCTSQAMNATLGYTLKLQYITDNDYLSRTREETRRNGARYVSNYLVKQLRDIPEFEKLEL